MMSDDIHYQGGKFLWKRITKNTIGDGLIVRVLNSDTGKYLSDLKGVPIAYNGSNLQDWDIWSSKNEFHNEPLLLVLSEK